MAAIYVFDKNCDDFTSFGLVGALTPTSCVFEEEANGMSEITLEHPIDALGRYTALACNNIIMAEVPVRTTPEIDGTSFSTSVEQWIVRDKAVTTKGQRTLYSKKTNGRKIKVLPQGSEVTVVRKPDEGRVKVKTKYGSGWMNRNGLEYSTTVVIPDNSHAIESVQPAWAVKPQLFRIYNVEKGILDVTVNARHISYDLLFNLTTYKNTNSVACDTALAEIMGKCIAPHEFEAYTNLTTEHVGVDWTRTNPIDALLNPETGLTALYGASLIRDNWELYVLHDPGLNRGVTVEYGKNMTGIKYTESYEDVVTRIVPLGEKKDGDPLLLAGDSPWVDSPHINDYPVVYAQTLECKNCKVGTNNVTTTLARNRMKEQAEKVFENGGDLPSVEMTVDFVNLGDTAEYSQYKDLERLFLWDYVLVRHKLHNIDVTSRIVKITWDCMLDRMQGMEIGKVGKTLANSGITTWQIPTGFSGNKIAGGTIGNAALQPDIISARHMQADSVSANAIQAGSVNAEKIESHSITADQIKTGALDAISVNAVSAYIAKLVADKITTDSLYANIAKISDAEIDSADIDFGQIKDMVAGTAIITKGNAGQLYISRLSVTEANMVSLTVGELVVKGKDGSFYSVSVDEDGNIKTDLKQIANDDVKDLSLNAGEKIIEGTVTAACLNAQNIFGENAIIQQLIAANMDVATLFAQDAFIGALTTNTIIGDKSITIMAQDIAANEAAIAEQNKTLVKAVNDITGLQNQIDGSITTWYYEGVPTASNEPAVNWTTEALKEAHQGDLYYDKLSNQSYRWLKKDSTWAWELVVDSELNSVLDAAAKAQSTADAKKRIFATQPAPPYDVGDLWVQGSGGDIYVCKNTKLETSYFEQSDWKIASKYTDDTKANAAQQSANGAALAAAAAQTTANNASTAAANAQSAANAAQSSADNAQADADTAAEVAKNAVEAIGDIPQKVEVTLEGLFLKDQDNTSVLRVNSGSVTIGTLTGDGAGYSQFAANYVQFGQYQMRRTTDGGLAFKLGG